MQADSSPGRHRTDARRGSRERVERGIFRRGGRWIVSYSLDGVDHYKTLGFIRCDRYPEGLTLRDARAEREALQVRSREGNAVAPSAVTVDEIAQRFFAHFEGRVAVGERSERTLALYRQRYGSHLKAPLGRVKVQQVRASHVQAVLDELRRKGLSSWTVRGVYVVASKILNHAVAQDVIVVSPLKGMQDEDRPVGRNRSKPRIVTDGEIEKLLASATPTYRPVIAVAAFAGLRVSEILALRFSDIDFEEKLIRVRHSLTRAAKGAPARLKPLKTDAGERDVELLPRLERILRDHRQSALSRGQARPEDYVFQTVAGTPLAQAHVGAAMRKAVGKAKLNVGKGERLSLHALRHGFVSRLVASGLDVVTVQRQAGHRKASFTLDRYAHEFKQAQAAQREETRRQVLASGFGA